MHILGFAVKELSLSLSLFYEGKIRLNGSWRVVLASVNNHSFQNVWKEQKYNRAVRISCPAGVALAWIHIITQCVFVHRQCDLWSLITHTETKCYACVHVWVCVCVFHKSDNQIFVNEMKSLPPLPPLPASILAGRGSNSNDRRLMWLS